MEGQWCHEGCQLGWGTFGCKGKRTQRDPAAHMILVPCTSFIRRLTSRHILITCARTSRCQGVEFQYFTYGSEYSRRSVGNSRDIKHFPLLIPNTWESNWSLRVAPVDWLISADMPFTSMYGCQVQWPNVDR